MSNNIFIVKKESHIDEIISSPVNQFKLIALIIATSNTAILPQQTNANIKKLFKRNFAVNNPDTIFLYIDLNDYEWTVQEKYTNKITKYNIPFCQFIFNTSILCRIENAAPAAIRDTLVKLKQEISQKVFSRKSTESISDNDNPLPSQSISRDLTSHSGVEQSVTQPAIQSVTQPVIQSVNQPVTQQPATQVEQINQPVQSSQHQIVNQNTEQQQAQQMQNLLDPMTIQKQILEQRKLEEIEKLKTVLVMNELKKIQKMKENQESKQKNKSKNTSRSDTDS